MRSGDWLPVVRGALCTSMIAALALTGCGTKDPAALTADPASTASASVTAEPSHTDLPAPPRPKDTPAQTIELVDVGVTFDLPKAWITLYAGDVTGPRQPLVKDAARRISRTPQQLIDFMRRSLISVMSVSNKGEAGSLTDYVSVLLLPVKINYHSIRKAMERRGGRTGELEHTSSPAGVVKRLPYELQINGVTAYGVDIAVHVREITTRILVHAHSEAAAAELADQIHGSLNLGPCRPKCATPFLSTPPSGQD